MKLRDILSFLAFAVIIAFSVSYLGSLGVRVQPPADRTSVTMTVPDINGLVAGSNVLLRGVPIGQVTKLTTSTEGSTVDFYFEDRYRIPVDSDVRLDNLSALGESYIGLLPRSEGGPLIQNHQRIDTQRVIQPPSISELTTSVVRVLNQLDPGELERIVNEADAALPDSTTVLPNLTHASQLLRDTASNMDGRGRQMLDNFQSLLRNAGFVGPALAAIGAQLPTIGAYLERAWLAFGVIVDQGGPGTERNFNNFLKRIQKFLDDRAPDIKVLTEALLPKMQGIAGALMNFDTGQILSNMLAAVPEDGAITLHVTIPDK
jgi:phospholipid/cholesterol/gamma-HCH transport system substrate-binding protein